MSETVASEGSELSFVPPPALKQKRSSGYFTIGREFYDDMYEDDADEVSIEDTLNFSTSPSDFRKTEIQALHKAYSIIRDDPVRSHSSDSRLFAKSKSSRACPVCLIRGPSGAGKSTLFKQFVTQIEEDLQEQFGASSTRKGEDNSDSNCRKRPYILRGKFEELSGDNPLAGIVDAFSSLAANLKAAGRARGGDEYGELRELRHRIIRKLGGRQVAAEVGSILPGLLPLLQPRSNRMATQNQKLPESADGDTGIVPTSVIADDAASQITKDDKSQRTKSLGEVIPDKNSNEHAWNRLKYILQAMIQAICNSGDRPTILFIDDLQWADTGTLEVLELLLLDQIEMPNFMFVGAYRSDHDLGACRQMIEKATKNGSSVTTVDVKNLTLDGMKTFLKHTFRMTGGLIEDAETYETEMIRVAELAAVLHSKTGGNIFFTRQILEELYSKGSLSFSRLTFTWEWDLDQIDVSDNVLEAVSQRIRTNCSEMLQTILITAAYMRSTVDADSLMLAVDFGHKASSGSGATNFKPIKQQLIEELDKAVTGGFLSNMTGCNNYSFAHDRIKQAAYNMVEEGPTREKFRRSIANRLYRLSKDKRLGRDWMIFSAADHFNATPQSDQMFLAMVNLEAGKRCMKVASFGAASKYLGQALDCLGGREDVWIYHYKMSHQIHASKAEADLLLGNIEEGERTAQILFDHAKTTGDKLRTQMILAKAFGWKESHLQSFELSRKTLKSLNLYPKTSMGIIGTLMRDILYIQRYFRYHSNEDFLSLPYPKDQTQSTIVDLYQLTAYQAFFCGNKIEFLVAIVKGMRFTLANGIFPSSSILCQGLFLLSDNLGDQKGANRFSKLGLAVLDRVDDKSHFSFQLMFKTTMLDSWSTETQAVVDNYNYGHRRGMEAGDFDNAMLSRSLGLEHQFAAGHSLAVLDIQFADCLARMKVLNVGSMQHSARGHWYPIRYLRGTAEDAITTASPLPFDFEKKLDFSEYDSSGIAKLLHFRGALQIGVYWNNVEFLERLVKVRVPSLDKSHCHQAIRLFFLAIAYGKLHQRSKIPHKRYLRKGRGYAKELRKLCESKGMNSWHRYKIASAYLEVCAKRRFQQKTWSSSSEALLKPLEKAIELAVHRKHKHDSALGAQLLVEHVLWMYSAPNKTLVEKYINMARKLYKEWGASNLVRHLERVYPKHMFVGDQPVHDCNPYLDPFSVPVSLTSNNVSADDSTDREVAVKSLATVASHTLFRDDLSAITPEQ